MVDDDKSVEVVDRDGIGGNFDSDDLHCIDIFPSITSLTISQTFHNACQIWTAKQLQCQTLRSAKSVFVRYHGPSGHLCPRQRQQHLLTMIASSKDCTAGRPNSFADR